MHHKPCRSWEIPSYQRNSFDPISGVTSTLYYSQVDTKLHTWSNILSSSEGLLNPCKKIANISQYPCVILIPLRTLHTINIYMCHEFSICILINSSMHSFGQSMLQLRKFNVGSIDEKPRNLLL